jgi:hypothetical protein
VPEFQRIRGEYGEWMTSSSERVPCENVIAMLKRFKIIAYRYRNRRRRFGLRFFLIAAIYNKELQLP